MMKEGDEERWCDAAAALRAQLVAGSSTNKQAYAVKWSLPSVASGVQLFSSLLHSCGFGIEWTVRDTQSTGPSELSWWQVAWQINSQVAYAVKCCLPSVARVLPGKSCCLRGSKVFLFITFQSFSTHRFVLMARWLKLVSNEQLGIPSQLVPPNVVHRVPLFSLCFQWYSVSYLFFFTCKQQIMLTLTLTHKGSLHSFPVVQIKPKNLLRSWCTSLATSSSVIIV